MAQWGLLLINLGTPAAPSVGAVRRYLREFLGDPRVLTMPGPLRFLLLYLLILPFRARKSAAAYRHIWTEEGSPLLVHGRALTSALQTALGEDVPVALAMRYQEPSLQAGLERLRQAGVERIVVLPLYPQYASSTWGSTAQEVFRLASRGENVPALQFVPPFYAHPAYLKAQAGLAQPFLQEHKPERVVFSFHGLPERHIHRADETRSHCLARPDCCQQIQTCNRNCYRAQCFATARGIAALLQLGPERYAVTFQSRLGPTAWIRPHTDEYLRGLHQEGIKRVLMLSPAFVADCLETLEELGLLARDEFLQAGGESFELVPALNSHPDWVAALQKILAPWSAPR